MTHEKRIVLDPRLSMIAEMVGQADCYADIGCDHGRLGAFLLQRGWVKRAIMTDISDPSLEKARALIRLLGLDARARLVACDGADGLDSPVDAAVIAGMGGTTIAGIVERGREKLGNARLVLQANVALYELRQRLSLCGYVISDERIVRDGRRQYVVLSAEPGNAAYDARELTVGPVLLKARPVGLEGYAAFRLRVLGKALEGALRSDGGEEEKVRALREEIAIWEALRNGD